MMKAAEVMEAHKRLEVIAYLEEEYTKEISAYLRGDVEIRGDIESNILRLPRLPEPDGEGLRSYVVEAILGWRDAYIERQREWLRERGVE